MICDALDKRVLHFRVDDEIHIALAVAQIGIRQAVELLRQHLQALARAASQPEA